MTIERFYRDVCQLKNEALTEACVGATRERYFKKGAFLVREGEPEPDICFLVSGICRGFYLTDQGREVTDCFEFRQGAVIRASNHLDLDTSAPFSVEWLEDSLCYCLPVAEVLRLQQLHPEVSQVWNGLLRESFDRHWQTERVLHQYNAEGRYLWFLREYPGLIQRVSNRHIASFLGMNPVTLSRLRGRRQENDEDRESEAAKANG